MEPVNRGGESPKITFCNDGGRPKVKKYSNEPKFQVNDEVYICTTGTTTREGPYKVSSVSNGTYTLCDGNGNVVNDGNTFEEKNLELKDPFE